MCLDNRDNHWTSCIVSVVTCLDFAQLRQRGAAKQRDTSLVSLASPCSQDTRDLTIFKKNKGLLVEKCKGNMSVSWSWWCQEVHLRQRCNYLAYVSGLSKAVWIYYSSWIRYSLVTFSVIYFCLVTYLLEKRRNSLLEKGYLSTHHVEKT